MRFVYSEEDLFAKTTSRAKFSMPHTPALSPKLIRAGEPVKAKENLNGDSFYSSRENLIFFNQSNLFRRTLEEQVLLQTYRIFFHLLRKPTFQESNKIFAEKGKTFSLRPLDHCRWATQVPTSFNFSLHLSRTMYRTNIYYSCACTKPRKIN